MSGFGIPYDMPVLGRAVKSFSNTQCLPELSDDTRPRRLVDVQSFKLVDFHSREDVPPYAILFHRWVLDQEVTLQEFLEFRDVTKAKLGYHKIQAAVRQALEDGFLYIWIDTCCIDKGNHGDVVRNIRSMRCVTCISRTLMHIQEKVFNPSKWESRESQRGEWLERGWTLQELLAPRKVIFFDISWTRLGSNHDLQDVISWVTTIPPEILSGQQSVRVHSVDSLKRMTWAIGKEKTKPQDQAYCLLSLLGVSVNPDYDEDVRASFERLRKVPPRAQKDFYSFLDDRYQDARWDAVDFERIRIRIRIGHGRQIIFCYHFSRYALDNLKH
ncbi:hypothetical protein K435DRAFT_838360 [Dendrothele bispora CBS 962.96]|uniref:Heterokaryon incompatibility domain-containing protein n=1 Tax=Dendrothele bispora (strain CBS 962.96) TaxID=1314807 RepID=A0A4S8M7P4_DENBC|nr:hypothetical protein K435DRAFT_838360 [Dendrothele bispora CBS 962.96]